MNFLGAYLNHDLLTRHMHVKSRLQFARDLLKCDDDFFKQILYSGESKIEPFGHEWACPQEESDAPWRIVTKEEWAKIPVSTVNT